MGLSVLWEGNRELPSEGRSAASAGEEASAQRQRQAPHQGELWRPAAGVHAVCRGARLRPGRGKEGGRDFRGEHGRLQEDAMIC